MVEETRGYLKHTRVIDHACVGVSHQEHREQGESPELGGGQRASRSDNVIISEAGAVATIHEPLRNEEEDNNADCDSCTTHDTGQLSLTHSTQLLGEFRTFRASAKSRLTNGCERDNQELRVEVK